MKDRHNIDREIYSKLIPEGELTWRDLKELQRLRLKLDDRIYIEEKVRYNEDGLDDRWIVLSINRYTPETDEEYYKRIGEEELEKQAFEARMKEVRRKKYLELKQEFEDDSI
jgi:hypothetical protein